MENTYILITSEKHRYEIDFATAKTFQDGMLEGKFQFIMNGVVFRIDSLTPKRIWIDKENQRLKEKFGSEKRCRDCLELTSERGSVCWSCKAKSVKLTEPLKKPVSKQTVEAVKKKCDSILSNSK